MVKVTSTNLFWHDGLVPIPTQTTFVLHGVTYEVAGPGRQGPVEAVRTWPPVERPRVHARIQIKGGAALHVYAEATAWNATQIHVRWHDDNNDSLTSWVSKDDVRRVTDSEWDIDEYNRTPEWLRVVRWGANFEHRLPGFLPQ